MVGVGARGKTGVVCFCALARKSLPGSAARALAVAKLARL